MQRKATDGNRTPMRQFNTIPHSADKFSLADFGFDADELDRRLMFYREHCNILYANTHLHTGACAG